MTTFSSLGIHDWLVNQLKKLSIDKPTDIQINTIPQILKGKNIIAAAKTGSGKTLCFCLSMIQELAIEPFGIHSLILTPTRELAFQIGEQCRILGTSIGLKISIIVGGMDMTRQDVELSQKPHIVIATPGRLRDHIQSHQLHFKRIQYLVMDEADRLLDPSFESDLEIILQELPKKRKTLLFSATMTKEIEELKFQHAEEPFVYSMENRFDTVSTLDHRYIFIPSTVSEAYLCWLILNEFQSKSIIIFCSRPKTCQVLQIILYQLGARSTCLHSHMSQQERLNSIAKFKGGIIPILISTDVGSRGLDIPQVEVVLNYQLPSDPADYIHRIGRTARAGRGGMSLSIVTERDIEIVETIEALTKVKMVEYPIEEKQVLDLLDDVNVAKRQANIDLLDRDFGMNQKIQKIKHGVQRKKPKVSKK